MQVPQAKIVDAIRKNRLRHVRQRADIQLAHAIAFHRGTPCDKEMPGNDDRELRPQIQTHLLAIAITSP
jgi:hypothetical protein